MNGQSQYLTEKETEYVFKQIIMDYGLPLVKNKWETVSPHDLKGNISRRLGGYTWDTVLWSLDEMIKAYRDYPPTVPQLADICDKRPKPQEYFTALPAPTITREEAERRGREMEEAAKKIAAKMPGMEWAEKIMKAPKNYPAYSVSLARAALKERE
jgi:hypothetical protein